MGNCHFNVLLPLQEFLKILLELNSRRSVILDVPQTDHETLDKSLYLPANQFCYHGKETVTHFIAFLLQYKKNCMRKSLPNVKCYSKISYPSWQCNLCNLPLLTETLHDWFVLVLAEVVCTHSSLSPFPSRDLNYSTELFLPRLSLLKEQSTSGWNTNKWFSLK